MENLKIEYVSLDTIKPYERNAKLHPDEQIQQICNSIKETGFNDPIGVWHDEVVEGHGRLLAAQKLGMKKVPVIRLDNLTDEQRKAYMLAHNKLTMNTDFDLELLEMELAEIETIDMQLLGFEKHNDFEESNDIESAAGFSEKYNVIIECSDINQAEALAKLLHVDLDLTRQRIACKYEDISL